MVKCQIEGCKGRCVMCEIGHTLVIVELQEHYCEDHEHLRKSNLMDTKVPMPVVSKAPEEPALEID